MTTRPSTFWLAVAALVLSVLSVTLVVVTTKKTESDFEFVANQSSAGGVWVTNRKTGRVSFISPMDAKTENYKIP